MCQNKGFNNFEIYKWQASNIFETVIYVSSILFINLVYYNK